jgi:hypothetical protein
MMGRSPWICAGLGGDELPGRQFLSEVRMGAG